MGKQKNSEFFESVRRSIKISYFVASIIPISILVYLSAKYIQPYLNSTDQNAYVSIGVILVLTVIISVLGFILIVKTTNKTLYSIQDSYDKLNSLLEVSKHFRDTLYVDVLLESITGSATELLDAEAGSLLLTDDEGALWFKVVTGAASRDLKDKSVTKGEGITGWVLEHGEPAVINKVDKDERFSNRLDDATGFVTRSILCVPLIYEKVTIGVLEVVNKKEGEFSESDEKILFSLADQAAISIAQSQSRESEHSDIVQMTEILVNAMDNHIPIKKGHTKRVARHAGAIGRVMGLDDEDLKKLHFSAVLHDIGLLRFQYFEQMEGQNLEQHPTIGYEMVRPISSWKDIAQIILFHHERMDGSGYPTGKKGEEIPLLSRIISVADAFDVMTNESNYKEILSNEKAVEELEQNAGTQFDPKVVEAFKQTLSTVD
ncbi:MAG: GAF domain-containing protein [Nitrospirota bacterium]|nr:MAG: GAF domain-containing protein [Nitrospirota bacterium]